MNGWNPQFRIQGQVCHLIGPLESANEMQARFLQIYFMDGDQQIQRRSSITDGLCNSILLNIQEALNQNHKYVKELKCAYEFASSRQIENFRIVINEAARPLRTHGRTHNAPTLNEEMWSTKKCYKQVSAKFFRLVIINIFLYRLFFLR